MTSPASRAHKGLAGQKEASMYAHAREENPHIAPPGERADNSTPARRHGAQNAPDCYSLGPGFRFCLTAKLVRSPAVRGEVRS